MRRFSRVNRVLSFQVARFIAMSPGRNGTGVDEEGATCGPTRASSTEDDRGEREREKSIPRAKATKPFRTWRTERPRVSRIVDKVPSDPTAMANDRRARSGAWFMGRSRGLRLLANSGVLYLHVPAHTRVHISFSQSFSSSLHATQPVRTPTRIIHVRPIRIRKDLLPASAQLSRFPAGESSLGQNARDISERDTISLPLFLRCRDIVVTAIASWEKLAKEDRDSVHRHE